MGPDSEPEPLSSLSLWINDIYAQENKSDLLVTKMATKLDTLGASVEQKNNQLHQLEMENGELSLSKQHLDAILDSRCWKIMQRVQNIREKLIPLGSKQEQFFRRLIGEK